MVVDIASIGKILLIVITIVVVGYIFVAGFKGNSEMHGNDSGSSKSSSSTNTTTKSEKKEG